MSINGQFRQISPRALDLVVARPGLAGAAPDWRPAPEPGDPLGGLPAGVRAILENLPGSARAAALGPVMEALRAASAGMSDLYAEETAELREAGIGDTDLPEPLEIRKRRHPLHFLLGGEAREAPWPLGAVVLGGKEVGDDMGYGLARILRPAQVAELAGALEALGEEGAMARYVPAEFEAADIAPTGWEDPEEDEERREWLLETIREVRDDYVEARSRGYGMLLALV